MMHGPSASPICPSGSPGTQPQDHLPSKLAMRQLIHISSGVHVTQTRAGAGSQRHVSC